MCNPCATVSISGEKRVELIGGGAAHARDQVAVNIEGHADRGVAEPFLHHLGMDTLREEQRRRRVPQRVERHIGQAGTKHDQLEGA